MLGTVDGINLLVVILTTQQIPSLLSTPNMIVIPTVIRTSALHRQPLLNPAQSALILVHLRFNLRFWHPADTVVF